MTRKTKMWVIVCQILGLVFLTWQIGCAKDGGGDDDDSTGDDDDNGGEDVTIDPANMVDDLEDGDDAIIEQEGRVGDWFVYNDETEGTQEPPEDAVKPHEGGPEGSTMAIWTKGSGFTEWGAGIGLSVNDQGEAQKGVFDASAFTGLAFHARGNCAIRAIIMDLEVIHIDEGGTCEAADDAPDDELCDNGHGLNFELTDTWTQYKLPFSEIAQDEGWGKPFEFDSKTIAMVLWEVKEDTNFDYEIDNVGFY